MDENGYCHLYVACLQLVYPRRERALMAFAIIPQTQPPPYRKVRLPICSFFFFCDCFN
ncbi:hypothetical protein RND71_032085 [Anisodus tanguticus]|uniref:Uncharacterized protein n=1 Tax=Anisodus tanguticus TaxID=243964 RepID=A0AAE1V6D8_9SOLA|nr:hypothetical protein RND71_032085 [Anisodus tanguticus]